MKKALIFGVSGFVGSYLSYELKQNGYEVYGSDVIKSKILPEFVRFSNSDILNSESVQNLLESIMPTHVINLAAISNVGLSWKIPQKTVEVNVEGTLNILEAARKLSQPPRLLLIGSSEEYVVCKKPIHERTPIVANNPYGLSKMMQEYFSRMYRQRYGMMIYYVRAFNHTGVGQQDTFVIPSWCKQVARISKSGKPGELHVGDLSVKRDFSHVKDIVRAYRMVMESENCTPVYNVGSGIAVALKDLLQYIVSLSSQPITVKVDPKLLRPVDNPVICCNNSLIKEKIGWKPEYTVYDAIKEIVKSYM